MKFPAVKSIILNECHAAAVAYDRVGINASEEEYAAIAEEICLDYANALSIVAIENEPNPAKLKWNS